MSLNQEQIEEIVVLLSKAHENTPLGVCRGLIEPVIQTALSAIRQSAHATKCLDESDYDNDRLESVIAALTVERDALREAIEQQSVEWRVAWDIKPGSVKKGATLPSTESQAKADMKSVLRYPMRYPNCRLESRTVSGWVAARADLEAAVEENRANKLARA